MQDLNIVYLTGIVKKIYPLVTTPAEVIVSRFVLEHNSLQVEAGKERRVKCKMFCIYVGARIKDDYLNQQVKVSGFLSINTQKQIILHITNLNNLD